MPNGIINRADYDKIKSTEVKLGILFETQLEMTKILKDNIKKIDERFEAGNNKFHKLEKSRLKDKGFAGLTGIIGGFLASLAKGGG